MTRPPSATSVIDNNHDVSHEAWVSGALQDPDAAYTNHDSPSPRTVDGHTSFAHVVPNRDSLTALEKLPPEAHASFGEAGCAIHTALPDSVYSVASGGSIGSAENTTSVSSINAKAGCAPSESPMGEPSNQGSDTYAQKIEALSTQLPHLKNVRSKRWRSGARVDCYDFKDGLLISSKFFRGKIGFPDFLTNENERLDTVLTEQHVNSLQSRVIVATDLSKELIECLGSSLSISPEMFEEHLLNASLQKPRTVDSEPDTWVTHNFPKDYVSFKWYRPVRRTLRRFYSIADRSILLAHRSKPFYWREPEPRSGMPGKPESVKHESRFVRNIFRPSWTFKAEGEDELNKGLLCAWEERATIWSTQRQGCQIGMSNQDLNRPSHNNGAVLILLDPLPEIHDRVTGLPRVWQKLGLYNSSTHSLPSRRNSDASGDMDGPHFPPLRTVAPNSSSGHQNDLHRRAEGSALLGKLQRYILRSLNQKPVKGTVGDLHRPDQLDSEKGRSRRQATSGNSESTKNVGGQGKFIDASSRITSISGEDQRGDRPDDDAAPEVEFEDEDGHNVTLEAGTSAMFKQVGARGPPVDYDFLMSLEGLDYLAKHIRSTKCTARTLWEWLWHQNQGPEGFRSGAKFFLECLFTIAQQDTLIILRLMSSALSDLGNDMLDDILIQDRIYHWRHLLNRFDIELAALENTLKRFASFVEATDITNDVESSRPSITRIKFDDTFAQIVELRKRTNRSFKALMANMSIVESRRGIAEAESVTKLTELAFFFIPLTFSASIFSMQIKEFSSPDVSISAFFAVAIIITTCSYTLRLVIRSVIFVRLRRKLLENIRFDANLPLGAPIPTKTFLVWAWNRIGPTTFFNIILVTIFLVPTAVLWTLNMNHGFKSLITILLFLFVLFAFWINTKAWV
ncbi:MAG: hypothetical protein Q9164_006108 [Protoblastenia rupestris]